MKRRVLEIELAGHASVIRGPGAYKLIEETTGRRPVWIPLVRGFSVQEGTARDVVAAAETRFYDVVITGRRAASANGVEVATRSDPVADPGAGLW